MSFYFVWLILTSITGNPLGAALVMLVAWFIVDRFTFGILPDPLRFIARRRREWALQHDMRVNPHDRRARLELAQLLVVRKSYPRAVDLLRPSLEHGDDDLETIFTMGSACVGAGFADQGEKLLAHVIEKDHDFRVGEVYLVLGRGRLQRKDFAGAKSALETYVKHREGTVEGRVLLSRALDGLGDDASGALMRDQAWREFTHAPRFQRRVERLWAWRAQPLRPVLYGVLVIIFAVVALKTVMPTLAEWSHRMNSGGSYVDPSLQDPDE